VPRTPKPLKKVSRLNQPATKHDLRAWGNSIKIDLRGEMKAMKKEILTDLRGEMKAIKKEILTDLRGEMKAMKGEILYYFDAVVEHIHDEMKGANRDEISLLQDKVRQHDEDISRIKEQVNL